MGAWTRITNLAEAEAEAEIESLSLEDPLHFRVIGRVQGVGYRQWTVRTAQSLSLAGWVRNCADGSVEVLVSGAEANRRKLLRQSLTGPRLARVTALERINSTSDDPSLPPVRRNLMLQIDSV